jgi:non-lysosomal glucosylceramidase
MVEYGYNANLEGCVPLGGIGTGKVEIDNEGKMSNLTIANNWGVPTRRMRGFHVFVKPDDGEPFFVEKFLPMKNFSAYEPDDLTYRGEFPFATLKATKGSVEVTMEVFSSLVPGNLDDSTIPAMGISVKVKGSKKGSIAVSVSNIAGTNLIGRINKSVEGGVKFVNPRSNDFDGAKGELCLIAASPNQKVIQYNLNVYPAVALKEGFWKQIYENDQPWTSIAKGERLATDQHEVSGQWDDPAGVVISNYDGENQEVKFVFSWYFTGRWVLYPYGHYYHNKFQGAEEVARYFLKNYDSLRNKSREWHSTLVRKDLPDWLRDAIINTTYIFFSSTWLDEKGRFALIEATVNDPNVGVVAGFCYETGSLPLLVMFPELEKKFLGLLADAARPDGYIPHDLGIHSLDHPTDGTTSPPGWKDLGPSFILLVYRYYKWTGDKAFLEEMYPAMVKTLDWVLKQDKDGDGLPELEGSADASFDATPISGKDCYVSSIFVGSLIALKETARILGNGNDVDWVDGMLAKAKPSFDALFNGRYFEAWVGNPDPKGYVFMGQLSGEWWMHLLGLDSITDKKYIDSAFDTLYNVNAQASKYCTPNIVHENGTIWEVSRQAYSSMPRFVFGLSGYRYRLGDKRWLEVAKKEWDNIVTQGLVWNQPSRIDGRTGRPDPEVYFLDHYLGSAAPWTFTM